MKIPETRLAQCGLAFVAVIVLATLGCCAPAMGAEAPDAAFIAAALQQQESAPIDVVFTISEKPAGAPDTDELKDYIESHYVRTSDALWIKQKFNTNSKETTESSYDRSTKEHRALTTLQDGKALAHVRQGALVGALQEQSLLDPVRFYLSASSDGSATFLYQWAKYANVSQEMETIDGHTCWKLEIANPTPNAEQFVIWVDPTIGYCPRQVDVMRRGGIGRCRTRFGDYAEVEPGIWSPKLQVSDIPKTKSGPAVTITIKAKELKGGVKPDKASLLVKIPTGTRLYIDDMSEAIQAP